MVTKILIFDFSNLIVFVCQKQTVFLLFILFIQFVPLRSIYFVICALWAKKVQKSIFSLSFFIGFIWAKIVAVFTYETTNRYITTGFSKELSSPRLFSLRSNVFKYFFLLKYFNFTFYSSSDVSVELLKLFSPLLLLLNQFCFDFSHSVEQCRQEPLQRWWDRSSSTSCGNWRGNSIISIIWQSPQYADLTTTIDVDIIAGYKRDEKPSNCLHTTCRLNSLLND